MYSARNNNLFREHRLDDYLRGSLQSLNNKIEAMPPQQINSTTENVLVSDLVEKYTVVPPVLDEEKINIDAKEAMVAIGRNSRLDYDDPVSGKGLAITISVPFTGDSALFNSMPSTYSLSGTPDAQVYQGNIILNYETTEKDPERIKQLWLRDISIIKQNLAWINDDVSKHNASLETVIKSSILRRKKEANDYQSIIDKLKQG